MSMLQVDIPKEQIEAVEELKRRVVHEVPPHLKNDMFLYWRFLRARDFDINMAETMLRNHLTWRKANQIDSIYKYVVSDVILDKGKELPTMSPSEKDKRRRGTIFKYLPLSLAGFDKSGAPVRYFVFGDLDGKGLLKCVKKNVCVKSVVKCFEEDIAVMKEQSQKLGKPIEQWTYILNFENYTFAKATHKPTLEALIALFVAYEANYPERLKAAFVINASVYFTLLFSIIKPLLSGHTVSKVSIFGKDGWKEELLKHIDADELPAFLGGTKTDPDGNPLCKTFIKHGCLVPEEMYVSNKTAKRLSTQPGVQKVTVARMSKVTLNLDVKEAGSLIEWEFETEGKDIGFGLLYKDCNDDIQEIVPNLKIETQLISEVGMYQCESPGTYILVFDNTYSWIHHKDVYYKTSITSPEFVKAAY